MAQERVACGVIQPTGAELAVIGRYPGYDGALNNGGFIMVQPFTKGVDLKGVLTGAAPGESGIHVHSGVSQGHTWCTATPRTFPSVHC